MFTVRRVGGVWGGQIPISAISLACARAAREEDRAAAPHRVQRVALPCGDTPTDQSQPLNRNISHPPANHIPSIRIHLAHRPIAVPQ
eukprot:9498685-Pyramimonas_sp.AAC.2